MILLSVLTLIIVLSEAEFNIMTPMITYHAYSIYVCMNY